MLILRKPSGLSRNISDYLRKLVSILLFLLYAIVLDLSLSRSARVPRFCSVFKCVENPLVSIRCGEKLSEISKLSRAYSFRWIS